MVYAQARIRPRKCSGILREKQITESRPEDKTFVKINRKANMSYGGICRLSKPLREIQRKKRDIDIARELKKHEGNKL